MHLINLIRFSKDKNIAKANNQKVTNSYNDSS